MHCIIYYFPTYRQNKNNNKNKNNNNNKNSLQRIDYSSTAILSPQIASCGWCKNSSKSSGKNITGIDVDTTRTKTITSDRIGFVPIGTILYVPFDPLYGSCFTLRFTNFPQHVAEYVPRIIEDRRKYEKRIKISYRDGRILSRVSFKTVYACIHTECMHALFIMSCY